MKSTIKLALGTSLVLMLAVGCQKNKSVNVSSSNQNNLTELDNSDKMASKTDSLAERKPNACYDATHGNWCNRRVACNCVRLKEIIIKYMDLVHVSTSGDPVAVANLFTSSDMAALVNELDPSYVALLQSGTYYISIGNQDAQTILFLAGPTYPVTNTNFTFAFEFDK
jgi:hypothetical protein